MFFYKPATMIAIAEKPSLFNSDSDKELIFQNSDLSSQTALVNSAAYKAIASIPNQEVKDRLEDLRKDIALPLDKVRSLTAIYDREKEKRAENSSIGFSARFQGSVPVPAGE